MRKENTELTMRRSDNESSEFAYYSSIETLGGVDGPGLRLIIFLQGCPLRCLFCHNPETTPFSNKEKKITIDEVVDLYRRNESFYQSGGGGVTLSGGEALSQPEFVIALFKRLKEEKINTCIDTAAGPLSVLKPEQIREILKYTDLFLIDIKHPDPEVSIRLTGHSSQNQLDLVKLCEINHVKYWIRHVFVPQYSDVKDEFMVNLGRMIGNLKYMTKFEILPYHNMAIVKYDNLGWAYQLKDIEPPTKEQIAKAMSLIKQGVYEVRENPEKGLIMQYEK